MKRSVRSYVLASLLSLWTAHAFAAPAPPSPADPVYQQALNSFLAGDYDKALLLSAQALEKDPAHPKTRNLINVLAAEKEQDGKTVIWLAGKPAIVPAPPVMAPDQARVDEGLRGDLTALKQKVEDYYKGLLGRQESLQGQIRVIEDLVQDNSKAQYQEVRASQEAIYRKLETIEKTHHGPDLTLLYLLCGASFLLSLVALIKKPAKG